MQQNVILTVARKKLVLPVTVDHKTRGARDHAEDSFIEENGPSNRHVKKSRIPIAGIRINFTLLHDQSNVDVIRGGVESTLKPT